MSTTKRGFGQRVKQGFIALATTIGLGVGVTIAAASPAQAWGEYTYYYPVDTSKVCQHQGHTGASSQTPWNPYSLYCYDLSIPPSITFSGDLDIQAYCEWKYPGSIAIVDGGNNTIWDWKCKRKEWRP